MMNRLGWIALGQIANALKGRCAMTQMAMTMTMVMVRFPFDQCSRMVTTWVNS